MLKCQKGGETCYIGSIQRVTQPNAAEKKGENKINGKKKLQKTVTSQPTPTLSSKSLRDTLLSPVYLQTTKN